MNKYTYLDPLPARVRDCGCAWVIVDGRAEPVVFCPNHVKDIRDGRTKNGFVAPKTYSPCGNWGF